MTHEDEVPLAHTDLLVIDRDGVVQVRRFRIVGAECALEWDATTRPCTIGSHPDNDLVVEDPWASRYHCEIGGEASGVRVRDKGSLNGTFVDGMRVSEAWLKHGSQVRIGRTLLRFQIGTDVNKLPLSTQTQFGPLIGSSTAMRATFTLLERAAQSDATVLIEGESGTGKEGAAQAIHEHSARRAGPFVVVDCASIPENLLESELFGHERGAFTGADARRVGAFEQASGGTLFLDEIGELAPELQPKLLRVLESREIRRIGSNTVQPVDVRVIAATNRDLRSEVNAGRFRADLFYRLAVLRVPMPSLRQRPEDIPVLARHLLEQRGGAPLADRVLTPQVVASLSENAWPGNVRELRNHLDRFVVLADAAPLADADAGPLGGDDLPTYAEARREALAAFERRYLAALLARHQGSVARAAEAANMNRVYLYRLLHRHGLKE